MPFQEVDSIMNRDDKRRQKKLADKATNKAQTPQSSQATTQSPQPQQTLTIQQAIDLGVQHHNSGDLSKAESIYQQILQVRHRI